MRSDKSTISLKNIFRLSKKSIGMLIFIFFSVFACASENNVILDSANAAYSNGNFEKAIKLYSSIVDQNLESPELYFNLGNAYYKTNNIGAAVLNYERAKKLAPNDEDILTNLKFANQKTEDKIESAPQLFLTEWKNGLIDLMSEKGWSCLCIFTFCISLILIAMFVLSGNSGNKKAGFFGGATTGIITVIIFFMAQCKYEHTINSDEAIITSPSVTVNGSPNEKGTKLFILHEGTKVIITQEEADWTEVKIANGNVGWLKTKTLTII
jgi:tetratricopeptide (TPR) repeat protein